MKILLTGLEPYWDYLEDSLWAATEGLTTYSS